ncbi:MAG: Cobyrinic acid ac-diamide synthase [Thermovirga lienii]|nr:MAG: Cobyrinic acid ac-diamide synthase [Thermovirga lienii]
MKPKEIVVTSGKGGTGKTTLTSSLAAYLGNVTLCDADVDAPDLYILLKPSIKANYKFWGIDTAQVDSSKCIGCSRCFKTCRFDSITMINDKAIVDTNFCEGCAACAYVCPTNAISMVPTEQGTYYESTTNYGPMWHAQLFPGGENSGKLVQILRNRAKETALKEKIPYVIIDGPPGVACPAISSITGCDLTVAVTEPSASALSDLKRLTEVAKRFSVPMGIVINKSDIAPKVTDLIKEECQKEGLTVIGEIPFSEDIPKAISRREIPLEEMKPNIEKIWKTILHNLTSSPI